MGGGTGIFPVISALKQLSVEISTVIAVSDSGGSTGKIRDEFGFQAVGDLRQSLAALSEKGMSEWIRKILLYRFTKGAGLEGHNLGNLILTALQDLTGSTQEALSIAEKIFRIKGHVIPVTSDNVHLAVHYQDGSVAIGEHTLDANLAISPNKIVKVELIPHANLHPVAREAIVAADLVIIGPGDYYASLMATLVPTGIKEAFATSKAKVMYIVNLMSRATQTYNMPSSELVGGVEAAISKKLEYILINNGVIDSHLLKLYSDENEYPTQDDLGDDPRVTRQDLVSTVVIEKKSADQVHRSWLRHDKDKLVTVLSPFIE